MRERNVFVRPIMKSLCWRNGARRHDWEGYSRLTRGQFTSILKPSIAFVVLDDEDELTGYRVPPAPRWNPRRVQGCELLRS